MSLLPRLPTCHPRCILGRNQRRGNEDTTAHSPAAECYACTQAGVPAFHSTSCDKAHAPEWEAGAGSSLIPIKNRSSSASAERRRRPAWVFGQVLDPRSKRVQRWNRGLLLARAVSLAIDPLFFYALSIGRGGAPCLYMDGGLAAVVTVLRTCVDAVHLMHVWLQLRMAYVSRESLVVGCGKLVWDARTIAAHYLRSVKGFWFDLFVILPVPQTVFWLVVPKLIREEEIKLIMTMLLLIFLFQFLPKVYHSIYVMGRMQKVTGYIFGTIWWGFALNLIAYFIASHKVVVVKLDLHDDQAKQRAMKAASKLSGIDSMAIDMKEQKMTVIGEVDPVQVVSKLKPRKLLNAQIFSVEPIKEPGPKKEEPKKEEPKKEEPKKEEPKKEEPKKEEAKMEEPKTNEQQTIADLVNAYKSYNPQMTTYYYVQSTEENPNSCVIC